MAVAKPTISVSMLSPAEQASTQAATDTICGYIDTTNANVDTNTAAIAAVQALLQDLRRKLRAAGML